MMPGPGVRRAARWAAWGLVGLLAGGGCGKPRVPAPNPGPARFPTGEALAPGDLILGRSFGMVGSAFALYGAAPGPYSHAATYFEDECGNPFIANFRPNGMELTTPEAFFQRYLRLALVRYRPPHDPEALSRAARHWLAENERRRIPPDYHLDADDPSAMFCLELASHIYRTAGLPDPFAATLRLEDSPLLSRLSTMFGFEAVKAVPSPNAVLREPDFEVVATWEWRDYDLRREAVNEELARVAAESLLAGWTPRRAGPAGRFQVRQGLFLMRAFGAVMFWRPREPLPDYITKEKLFTGYSIYKHIAKAKKRALAELARAPFPPPDDADGRARALAEARAFVRAEAEATLPRHYWPPGEGPEACAP